MIPLPQSVRAILERIRTAGGRPILVGGLVRDAVWTKLGRAGSSVGDETMDPKDFDSLRMMGNAYLRMGKLEDAIEAYQEAIGRNGKYGFAYFDLGRALEKQERFEDAAAAYRKAVQLDKTLPHPHLYLAELLDEILDEPEEALTHYKQYLDLDGHGEGGWIKKRIEQLERDIAEKNKK